MVKFFILLISLIGSFVSFYFWHTNIIIINIGLVIIYFIIYLIFQGLIFFLVALLLSIPISRKKKTTKYSSFYRLVLYLYTKFCLSLFGVKTKVEGLEKLPKDENFVIVFNHRSNLDSMIMDVYLHKYPLVFVAKESLFHIPFFGKFIHRIGYLNLERGNIRQELYSIYQGIDFLNRNECSIGVAPEGTRNFTSTNLLPFKLGCLHLATKAKKPIVISVLLGTANIKKHLLTKRHIVEFKIIDVLDYEEFKNMTTREISEIIRKRMLNEIEKN